MSLATGHKWLNVPYDCGFFFARSLEQQAGIFRPSRDSGPPAYLNPSIPPEVEATLSDELKIEVSRPSPFMLGIENSRRFRALPVYCALLSLGEKGYRDIVHRNVAFARRLAKWMTEGEGKEWYEVLNLRTVPPLLANSSEQAAGVTEQTVPLNILLFRARESCSLEAFRPSTENHEKSLARAINVTTKMYVSPTEGAVRIAVSNWCTGTRVDADGNDDFDVVVGVLKGVMGQS
jgi:glutamate/tyrosine decarboxylase-like PLP-dependent enzyme